jgi:hypothetical protein
MKNKPMGLFLILALAVFEVFNFSITKVALTDQLVRSIGWATTLAILFCIIDLGGVARAFSASKTEPRISYNLVGVWLLVAAFNSTFIWWGVKISMLENFQTLGSIPVLVAIMMFLLRVLIVGTFAFAGNIIFQK